MQRESEFLYQELATILRSQIYSRLIKPGSLLLSENEMCRKYQVSRTSVRKALDKLHEEGLIVKMHGKGTMVSPDFTPDDDSNTLVIVTPYPSNYAARGLPLLIKLFQERYPGTKVKTLPVPMEEDTFPKEVFQFGVEPDLILMTEQHFHQTPHQMFIPLDELSPYVQDAPSNLVRNFMLEDRLYGIPMSYSPVFLAYNTELLAKYGVEPPQANWTFDQLKEAAIKLTHDLDGDGLTNIYGIGINSQLKRWLPFLIHRMSLSGDLGQTKILEGNDGAFDSEALLEVLTFFQEAMYKHRVTPTYTANHTERTLELFVEGYVAMTLTTTFAFKLNPLQFGTAQLPFSSRQSNLLIATAMSVVQFSKKQELAKMFLRFSLEHEVQREIAQSTGFLALSTSLNEEILSKERVDGLGLRSGDNDNADTGRFLNQIFEDRERLDTLESEMKLFWAGLESARSLVNRLKELKFFK